MTSEERDRIDTLIERFDNERAYIRDRLDDQDRVIGAIATRVGAIEMEDEIEKRVRHHLDTRNERRARRLYEKVNVGTGLIYCVIGGATGYLIHLFGR